MIASAAVIILGLLILFFPPLLSIVVGLLLIVAGATIALAIYDSSHRKDSIRRSRLATIILGEYRV